MYTLLIPLVSKQFQSHKLQLLAETQNIETFTLAAPFNLTLYKVPLKDKIPS